MEAGVSEPVKPVRSFTDAYQLLRRPFSPAAIRFKIQATFDGGAMVVAFIDARLVAGRLNMVIPADWSATYERPADGKGLICHLTVDGITRTDFGINEGYENAKADYSDALKRAAVQFGVGESLYVLPKLFLEEGNLLKPRKVRGKDTYQLTPAGEEHCRGIYAEWLKRQTTFGEPLDHGDQVYEPEDAVQDVAEEGVRPIDELGYLIEQADLSEDETTAIRQWVAPEGTLDEERVDGAIDLMNTGNLAELLRTVA